MAKRMAIAIICCGCLDNWFNILITILAVVAVVYVILRLLKVDALTMFYTGPKSQLPFGTLEENIHAINFDQAIQDALFRKEFRLAIRLLFLQALKLLADKNHIHWQPGKTNHEYVEELTAKQLKNRF